MPKPIGLFDSGLGGLTVLKAIRDILPNQNIIYLADHAHVPYGVKDRSHVQRLSYGLTGYLLGQGVKMVVIACNSATGAMFPEAKEDFSIPILGPIFPASKESLLKSPNKKIGILATTGTIKGGYYQKVLKDLEEGVELVCQDAPKLVELVERGQFIGEEVEGIVEGYLTPFKGKIDTLILGCTHFPYFLSIIKEALLHVNIIDPAIPLAREVFQLLRQGDSIGGEGEIRFLSTDPKGISPKALEPLKERLKLSSLSFAPIL